MLFVIQRSADYQHRTQAGNAMLIVALYNLNIKDLTSNDSVQQ